MFVAVAVVMAGVAVVVGRAGIDGRVVRLMLVDR